MSAAALRLNDVACLRGGRMLFRGIDLTLAPGDSALLHGANGVGKSSLLRICAGLLPAFAGTVERTGAVAMSDERMALEMDLPLGRALVFWARMDGASPDRQAAALNALGLERLSEVPVRMLSTGQRKRAMLARVAMANAPIWLLDEPANGLDAASIGLLGALVAGHLADGGVVVAASHQPLPLRGPVEIDIAAYGAAYAGENA